MSVSTLIISSAYVALVSSSFTRTMRPLRLLLIAGACCFIVFAVIEQIWSMVAWNVLIGAMHGFRLVRDDLQQRSIRLSETETAIRRRFFPDLNDFDFHVLWSAGSPVVVNNEVVIAAGTTPTTVSLIVSGIAEVERNGQVVRGIRRGGLLGEMSMVSGKPADVSVFARGELVLHQWSQRQLKTLDQLSPGSARSFRRLINRDLALKARLATIES